MKLIDSIKKHSDTITKVVIIINIIFAISFISNAITLIKRVDSVRPIEELIAEQSPSQLPTPTPELFKKPKTKERRMMLTQEILNEPKKIEETPSPLEGTEYYISLINQVCDNYDFYPYLPLLMQAIMQVESNYQPNLTSSAGCIGLMQVSPYWQEDRCNKLRIQDLWDPYSNILVATDLLEDLYYNYAHEDIYLAVMMYNMDFQNARALRASGVLSPYCKEVFDIYERLKGGQHAQAEDSSCNN